MSASWKCLAPAPSEGISPHRWGPGHARRRWWSRIQAPLRPRGCDCQIGLLQESLKADELFGTDPKKVAQLKEALAKSGPKGYWRRTLENYRESVKSNYVPPLLVAEACVRIDDKECAFEWLEKGFEERDDLMIDIKVEPLFDGLRSDPRFQDLERRVGIPQ